MEQERKTFSGLGRVQGATNPEVINQGYIR